jgi:four helix bundle protein
MKYLGCRNELVYKVESHKVFKAKKIMSIEKFEDIIAWQKAKELAFGIYSVFKLHRDFGFKDQIQRAGVSVMNNIAEGFERKSDKEFVHFLFIAKGSSAEVRSMLILALELKYINNNQYNKLNNLSVDVSRLLSGFIKKL